MRWAPSTVADRLWSKVEVRGLDDCWPWTATKNRRGYGMFSPTSRRSMHASRAAFIAVRGDPGVALFVCHRCDNPICCNPMHLFAGTALDNVRDMVAKGRAGHDWKSRITHCPRGHEYTVENTYVCKGSRHYRKCRECGRIHDRNRVGPDSLRQEVK